MGRWKALVAATVALFGASLISACGNSTDGADGSVSDPNAYLNGVIADLNKGDAKSVDDRWCRKDEDSRRMVATMANSKPALRSVEKIKEGATSLVWASFTGTLNGKPLAADGTDHFYLQLPDDKHPKTCIAYVNVEIPAVKPQEATSAAKHIEGLMNARNVKALEKETCPDAPLKGQMFSDRTHNTRVRLGAAKRGSEVQSVAFPVRGTYDGADAGKYASLELVSPDVGRTWCIDSFSTDF